MRTTLTLIVLATSLALTFGLAYAADTSVPGANNSTPGAESKGNPIPPPDQGTAGTGQPDAAQTEAGGTPPGGTISTPGGESKGNPIPAPQ
jgi:hypothetical protein